MPSKVKTPIKTLSLSALKGFNSKDLLGLYETTGITLKGETVAVLIPYQEYLQIQKLIMDSDKLIDELWEGQNRARSYD